MFVPFEFICGLDVGDQDISLEAELQKVLPII